MSAADKLVAALAWLPAWFVVIFISMIPFVELRGAIPVAVTVYEMDIVEAYVLAVIGNMIPVPFILLFLGRIDLDEGRKHQRQRVQRARGALVGKRAQA